jgi:hypothetical protein
MSSINNIRKTYGNNCEICKETMEIFNSKPMCDKCYEALKELILEKRKINDEPNRDNQA